MLKLINTRGGETWVHESRIDEYLARGFKIAAAPTPPPPKDAKRSGTNTKKRG